MITKDVVIGSLKFPSPCGELRVSDQDMNLDSAADVADVSVPLRGIEGV